MSLIKGKQIATGADGIATANLADGLLSADAAGRAKIASGYFDTATVNAKFGANAIDSIAAASIIAANAIGAAKLKLVGETYDFSTAVALRTATAPSIAADVANKFYVDTVAAGLDIHAACQVATVPSTSSANMVNFTVTANGQFTGVPNVIDGYTLQLNDRVFVKDQVSGVGVSAAQNGLYVVTAVGAGPSTAVLQRATDANSNVNLANGSFAFVQFGTLNADNGFVIFYTPPLALNTTLLNVTQFTGAGDIVAGNGISKSANTLSVLPDPTNQTITAAPAGVSVRRDANGGLVAGAAGLGVGQGNGIAVGTGTVSALGDNTSVSVGVGGISVIYGLVANVQPLGAANGAGSNAAASRVDHVHKRDLYNEDTFFAGTAGPQLTSSPGGSVPLSTSSTYQLIHPPVQNAALAFYLNGVLLEQGVDYTVASNIVTYLGGEPLNGGGPSPDAFQAKYASQG